MNFWETFLIVRKGQNKMKKQKKEGIDLNVKLVLWDKVTFQIFSILWI